MSRITAEQARTLFGDELYNYYCDQVKSEPRTRLTIKDFEDRGIDIVEELWTTLQLITKPKDKLDGLLKIMRFVLPTMTSVDINHGISQNNTGPQLDMSKIEPQTLVNILREEVNGSKPASITEGTNGS